MQGICTCQALNVYMCAYACMHVYTHMLIHVYFFEFLHPENYNYYYFINEKTVDHRDLQQDRDSMWWT